MGLDSGMQRKRQRLFGQSKYLIVTSPVFGNTIHIDEANFIKLNKKQANVSSMVPQRQGSLWIYIQGIVIGLNRCEVTHDFLAKK